MCLRIIEIVTVSGTGFSPISQKNVLISGGVSSSAVKIEKIPVGNNRVVSVEAKTSIDNILSKMAGVKMTSVTNITSGDNSVSVNWENSKLGNVFESLLALGYDVSAFMPTTKFTIPKENSNVPIFFRWATLESMSENRSKGPSVVFCESRSTLPSGQCIPRPFPA